MVVVNQKVITLINNGISLNKISSITGLGKSTIYYHYKKIKGKKLKPITFNFKDDFELGEFMGIFAGDGSFCKNIKSYNYVTRIHIGYYEKEYAYHLIKKFSEIFSKKPFIEIRNYNNQPSCINICYCSKILYMFIKNYLVWEGKKSQSVRLVKLDLNKKDFNIGFLRGLIDTDGSFYKPKHRISFSAISKELAEQYCKIIEKYFDFKPKFHLYKKTNCSDLYTFSLHGINAKKLSDTIQSANKSKIYMQ